MLVYVLIQKITDSKQLQLSTGLSDDVSSEGNAIQFVNDNSHLNTNQADANKIGNVQKV